MSEDEVAAKRRSAGPIFMKVKPKTSQIVPAKMMPADAEPELETSPSAIASSISNPPVIGQIIGEASSEDFGAPPRLSLVAATSAIAEEVPPGQWALSNGLGAAVALGSRIEIVPLIETKWWLMDFGQTECGSLPVRFLTEAEVRQFGGCLSKTPEPGKPTFSRSMEIRLVITSQIKVPGTFLRLPVGAHEYLAALYEASRTAFRVVGVGLNMTQVNTGEKPWERKWALGVTVRKNRSLNTTYFVPILEDRGRTSAAERVELARIVERQLPG
jgi:hypothetical protein